MRDLLPGARRHRGAIRHASPGVEDAPRNVTGGRPCHGRPPAHRHAYRRPPILQPVPVCRGRTPRHCAEQQQTSRHGLPVRAAAVAEGRRAEGEAAAHRTASDWRSKLYLSLPSLHHRPRGTARRRVRSALKPDQSSALSRPRPAEQCLALQAAARHGSAVPGTAASTARHCVSAVQADSLRRHPERAARSERLVMTNASWVSPAHSSSKEGLDLPSPIVPPSPTPAGTVPPSPTPARLTHVSERVARPARASTWAPRAPSTRHSTCHGLRAAVQLPTRSWGYPDLVSRQEQLSGLAGRAACRAVYRPRCLAIRRGAARFRGGAAALLPQGRGPSHGRTELVWARRLPERRGESGGSRGGQSLVK